MTDIKVSVLCLAYKHEAYVRRCLEGFVMQETDFPFEVIIHDDASPDHTADIIREYEAKYPELIRPIYQTENQYSKPNTPIMKTFLLPRARGQYFAICEGDDWWTDPHKLQRQVDYLDRHPECSACVHRAYWHEEGEAAAADREYPELTKEADFSAEDMIREGAGMFATNSFLVRREAYLGMPDCFFISGVGDYQMYIYAAICGSLHYLPQTMSLHNAGVPQSWTVSIWNDAEKRRAHTREIEAMLDRVNEFYGGRYTEAVADRKRRMADTLLEMEFEALIRENRLKEAAGAPYTGLWKRYRKNRRRAALKRCFPHLAALRRRLLGGAH